MNRSALAWPRSLAAPALLALLACAGSSPAARAQEAAGPSQEVRFRVTLQGREVGEEQATLSQGAQGLVIASEGRYRLTETPLDYSARLECQGVAALASYGFTSAQVRAGAQATAGGASYYAAYGAAGSEPQRGAGQSDAERPPPFVVLDTLAFAHYEALGRLALARQHAPFDFTLLTPQTLTCLRASLTPLGQRTLPIGGTPREVRDAKLVAGKLSVTLSYDAQSGRAYRIEDSQGYVAESPEWPHPWREEEVRFARDEEQVEGTWTWPGERAGPYPTLLILPGSGPQDRDSSLGPNAPLRDLARQLAARGVASLRCDKSATRLARDLSSGDPARVKAARARFGQLTFRDEYEADALPALAWLRARRDTRQLLLCGHSLGAQAAGEIASVTSEVAGLVLLAAPGRPLDELLKEQTTFQLERRGSEPAQIQAAVRQIERVFGQIRQGELAPSLNIMGAPVRYWRDLLRRPAPAERYGRVARELGLPVFALQGGNDCQVGPADFAAVEQALRGQARCEAVLLEDLNHLLFQTATPSTGEEYTQPGHVDERVAERIAAWVHRTFPAK